MRWQSCFLLCVVFSIIAVGTSPALARGGKGGGKGGGRPSFGGGGGGGGGGPRFSQPAKAGGNHAAAAEKPPKDKKVADKDQASHDKPAFKKDSPQVNSGEAYNKKQKQLDIEQRNRDKRLAQADHLREIAERNGNENLAANADRMEAFAHDHYARRVSQLEKFGVSDPTLDPGGLTDPLADPAGEFTQLPLLP